MASPLSQGRELKYAIVTTLKTMSDVAPLAGA